MGLVRAPLPGVATGPTAPESAKGVQFHVDPGVGVSAPIALAFTTRRVARRRGTLSFA